MKLRDLLKVIDGDVAITVKRIAGSYTRLYWSYDSKLLLEQRSSILNKFVLDVAACFNDNDEPVVAILIKE